jgi:hypothetical protein
MICESNKNNLRLTCPIQHPSCWDAHRSWTKSEKVRIVAERRSWCEKCENKPKKETIEPITETLVPNHESLRPISETPVTPEEVERIADRMKICIGCEKARFSKEVNQPSAAGWTPRTLRLAFTRSEYIYGVSNLVCQDKPGCCELSTALKDGTCEKFKNF